MGRTAFVGIAAALTLSACGSDSPSSPTQAGVGGAGQSSTTVATGSGAAAKAKPKTPVEKRQARETTEATAAVQQVYKAVGTKDGGSVCDLMTKADQKATAIYAQAKTCEEGFERLLVRSKRNGGGGKAKIIGVNVVGDRATATVQFGNGPATAVSLVKIDGAWKLGGGASAKDGK
jgi:hypothetical protein